MSTDPDRPDHAALQELLDRHAVEQCMVRYARGVDRLDRDLLVSAYHPDAVDDHGLFACSPEDFADLALAHHREHQSSTNHLILNHTCELEGDTAHSETYCVYVGRNRSGTVDMVGNRYLDRLERRDGRWAIVRRVCVADWASSLPGPDQMDDLMRAGVEALMTSGRAARNRSDISYQRPLEIDPEKVH